MNAVDHNNVVIFDDRGIPSIMCRFVRPKDAEEVPAVFKIGDKVADAIYISKYPNTVIDGRAYSMPMADPTANITFDEAVQACRCKGLGWHLMTAVEYEYLLNQSREKGTMPHGNTDWGKDYYHKDEQGKVSNFGRTYTGTGPVTWNHDHTPYGVSDLNGNVWEWLTGLRIKDGVIEFIPDNKAASPYCDLSKDSTEWQQAETSKGPVRANVECGEITITDTVVADDYTPDYDGVRIDELAYVVMHYTGNSKDTAKANANYFGGAGRNASAHFFVDDAEIYQSVELRDTAWHCGAKSYKHGSCRNANSIGIEMCCTAGNYRISDRTKENAAYLCAFLCKMLGIGAGGVDSYVLRHYDVTGKNCPAQMVSNPTEWQEFKNKVKGILGGSVSAGGQQHTAQPTTDNVASYKVKITADVLNVRIGPGTDYGVATQVKQGEVYTIVGEVRNGNTTWGKLKSGAGYISLGYTERIAGMTANTPQDTSYRVKINTAVLNVRKGPGTNYPVTTQVKQGEVYTIVGEEKNGNTTWGKLKSGAGYISLGYTQRA